MRTPEEARIQKLEERNSDLRSTIQAVRNQLKEAEECYVDEEYVRMHDFVSVARKKLDRVSLKED